MRIDDASLFELEELGLIKESDIVTALYKDFSSWDEVQQGSILLLLTQDDFIALRFTSPGEAHKLILPLSKIERLGVNCLGILGKDLRSFLLALRAQDKIVKLIITGDSYQDSPEEFCRQLLIDLDNAALGAPQRQPAEKRSLERPAAAPLRKIDFVEIAADETTAESANTRIIEF
jgi:hypothetical protein